MCKRGNYFIAMYDLEDNYIRDFNSIDECAGYFNTTNQVVSNYIFRKKIREERYRLFKIEDCQEAFSNKSL